MLAVDFNDAVLCVYCMCVVACVACVFVVQLCSIILLNY